MTHELIEKPTIVEVIAVSGKFIDNNKKNQTKKRGGPYDRKTREKRRQEVYKLYIEQNYPKTVITKWKGVNKNTITSDIRHIEKELAKEYDIHSILDLFRKYKHRFELQSARYYEEMKKEKDPDRKMMLEKRITELDDKIINTALRLSISVYAIKDLIAKALNNFCKEQNLDVRVLNPFDLSKASPEAYEKIQKILDDDKKVS